MSVFKKNYSQIYDVLYRNKNYFNEFNFIDRIIKNLIKIQKQF